MTSDGLAVDIERAPTAGAGWVVLINEGTDDVRVWQIGNTWGDEALSFVVSDGGSAVRVEREPQVYTRNLPESVELKPGARYRMPFDLLDGTWEFEAITRARPSQSIEVAAVYDVPPSPEAVVHQVWTGRISSERVTIPLGTRVR